MTKAKAKAEVKAADSPKSYVVATPFRDKHSKQHYQAGDDAGIFDAARLAELVAKKLVTAR